MRITKTSPFTGLSHTQEINVTAEQLNAWQRGALIQNAMPNLSADEREFIMTGITSDEWNNTFGTGTDEEKQAQAQEEFHAWSQACADEDALEEFNRQDAEADALRDDGIPF